ncbi:MAG: HU family DNA-binding protein [Nanoarchaeota archaeon]
MNKAELVEFIANKTGFTKADAEAALNATLNGIMKGVKKEDVQLVGFGTFRTVKTKARTGVNPQTGAKIKIPSKKVVKFKASKNPKY